MCYNVIHADILYSYSHLCSGEAINTDDENEEEEYEGWKVRELRRIKTVREDREAREKEVSNKHVYLIDNPENSRGLLKKGRTGVKKKGGK